MAPYHPSPQPLTPPAAAASHRPLAHFAGLLIWEMRVSTAAQFADFAPVFRRTSNDHKVVIPDPTGNSTGPVIKAWYPKVLILWCACVRACVRARVCWVCGWVGGCGALACHATQPAAARNSWWFFLSPPPSTWHQQVHSCTGVAGQALCHRLLSPAHPATHCRVAGRPAATPTVGRSSTPGHTPRPMEPGPSAQQRGWSTRCTSPVTSRGSRVSQLHTVGWGTAACCWAATFLRACVCWWVGVGWGGVARQRALLLQCMLLGAPWQQVAGYEKQLFDAPSPQRATCCPAPAPARTTQAASCRASWVVRRGAVAVPTRAAASRCGSCGGRAGLGRPICMCPRGVCRRQISAPSARSLCATTQQVGRQLGSTVWQALALCA